MDSVRSKDDENKGRIRTKGELHDIIIEDAKEMEKTPSRGRSSN